MSEPLNFVPKEVREELAAAIAAGVDPALIGAARKAINDVSEGVRVAYASIAEAVNRVRLAPDYLRAVAFQASRTQVAVVAARLKPFVAVIARNEPAMRDLPIATKYIRESVDGLDRVVRSVAMKFEAFDFEASVAAAAALGAMMTPRAKEH